MKAEEKKFAAAVAAQIGCRPEQVEAAADLFDGGATVPFVARYRKEATGGLDDVQLRALSEKLTYLRELEGRKAAVSAEIESQGKLDAALRARIAAASTKAEVEDLYLPFKKKRETRADKARKAGLGPLADAVMADHGADPSVLAARFVNEEVPDAAAALAGARDILSERFAEDADLAGDLRGRLKAKGRLKSKALVGKEAEGAKFADYFEHEEDWAKAPGHRVLAMLRGREEGFLGVEVVPPEGGEEDCRAAIARKNGVKPGRNAFLDDAVRWTWKVKFAPRLQTELLSDIRERAESEAISIFKRNLKDVLLAAPAGARTTIGLDPGIRTGVKVAVVDATGRLLETATVYPFQPRNDAAGSKAALLALALKHRAEIFAIGNGTASRETERLVGEVLKEWKGGGKPVKVVVSEQGASVYSASEIASKEMPDVDVSLRGAVSIARRLQDPLAELVKIEPKSIGVGQYQHDVDQSRLAKALDEAVEDAVNAVGVDLNMASAALLARVSGLGASTAEAIVARRDAKGAFRSRSELLEVPRLGAKAFEQCAGFLRIRDGDEPLDGSAVHPESYPVARRIIEACGRDVRSVLANAAATKGLDPARFADGKFGVPTVRDILGELAKPGRDPRPAFVAATLQEGVETIDDLKPGMKLEGTVTNVAAFGAFVDIGVHQDGLVHLSQLADRYVKDASEVVKAGDVVKVTVVSVDKGRKRIGLSMKAAPDIGGSETPKGTSSKPEARKAAPAGKGASRGGFGDALAAALARK